MEETAALEMWRCRLEFLAALLEVLKERPSVACIPSRIAAKNTAHEMLKFFSMPLS